MVISGEFDNKQQQRTITVITKTPSKYGIFMLMEATPCSYLEMAFNAVVTPDDLKRGDLVTPGWYNVEIDSYEEKEATTDKSTNCIFHFKIYEGSNKGVSPTAFFNEKALGFGKNLWKALEFPFDPEKGYALSSELFKQTPGSKLQVYLVRGKSNKGNEFNEVKDYRALPK